MSQHAQRTKNGPSVAAIAIHGAATLAALTLVSWLISGEVVTQKDLIGAALGLVLATLLGVRTLTTYADRQVARDRAERTAQRQALEAGRLAAARYRPPVDEPDPVATQPIPALADITATVPIVPAGLRSLAMPLERGGPVTTPRWIDEVTTGGRSPRTWPPAAAPEWAGEDTEVITRD